MDIMVILGFIAACGSFYYGVPELRTDYMLYLQPASFILVFGGTISSTLMSTSLGEFKNILKIFKHLIFKQKAIDELEAIHILVSVSEKSQTASKQDLTLTGKPIGDGFINRSLHLVASGLDKPFILRTLETDIQEIERRHVKFINIIRTMGAYAPMFGMIGTVMGVTQVLKNVTDISNIVAGMSLALLTTLYGIVLSSVFFIPLANKLKAQSAKEIMTKEMITEGIMMILDKEIPLKVEKYLTAYLESKHRKDDSD